MARMRYILPGRVVNTSANCSSALIPCKHAIYRSWGKAWARPGPPGIPLPNSEFGVNGLYPPRFQSLLDLVSLREQGHLCVRDGTADGETSGG